MTLFFQVVLLVSVPIPWSRWLSPADTSGCTNHQIELKPHEGGATFTCTSSFQKGPPLVVCARRWFANESGSAGDCFFFLGQGSTLLVDPVPTPSFFTPSAIPRRPPVRMARVNAHRTGMSQ